jgi:Bacterial protein of unknown function (DUF885)/Cyclophilin type peptidyl-prolyl cis-trans isomerase/CLD
MSPATPRSYLPSLPCAAWLLVLATMLACAPSAPARGTPADPAVGRGTLPRGTGVYDDLVTLFRDWRAFEQPGLLDGAPDYTASTFARRHAALATYQARLAAIDPSGWPIGQQIDHELVRAEMNGFDFHVRVLQPWARDPAFYNTVWTEQSDTPAHEGPTHHGLVELWTYAFPLSSSDAAKLARELRVIPPLLTQARGNLTGNARDLWLAGITTMKLQGTALADLDKRTAGAPAELGAAIRAASDATAGFVAWLEAQAPSKTGPSGIGKEHYTWSLQHVHLVPLTWDDEVAILGRELARAHTSLRLEEERNRKLPPLTPIASADEYRRRGNEGVTKLIGFLADRDLMQIQPYMDAALHPQIGQFVPAASRNFFAIAMHLEPMTLYTHFYHWWDLAQMRETPHPSPIRRGPLLYNIWDSRSEGMATAMEEMMLHAGLYDDNPRAREIVWIMLAQRAARGLGSLYAHANQLTMKQAADFHATWTPRGWMRTDLDLLGFEQQLYLRQPGYGTSYLTGKFLLERLIASRSRALGKDFTMKRFFAELGDAGMIPVSLIAWQLTGERDAIALTRWTSPGASSEAALLRTPESPALQQRAPEVCRVRLETTKGVIVLEMQRAWAPHGVDRFYNLVRAGYYDDAAIFRIRAGVWAQFGIHGDPAIAKAWRARTIPDDPRVLSNVRGTVAFAFKIRMGGPRRCISTCATTATSTTSSRSCRSRA